MMGDNNLSNPLPNANTVQKKHRSSKVRKLLPLGYRPSDYDVICGRGKGSYQQPGNERFRSIIAAHCAEYLSLETKAQKTLFVDKMIWLVRVQDKGTANFIKKDGKSQWEEMDETEIRDKVGHLVRAELLGSRTNAQKTTCRKIDVVQSKTKTKTKTQRHAVVPKIEMVKFGVQPNDMVKSVVQPNDMVKSVVQPNDMVKSNPMLSSGTSTCTNFVSSKLDTVVGPFHNSLSKLACIRNDHKQVSKKTQNIDMQLNQVNNNKSFTHGEMEPFHHPMPLDDPPFNCDTFFDESRFDMLPFHDPFSSGIGPDLIYIFLDLVEDLNQLDGTIG